MYRGIRKTMALARVNRLWLDKVVDNSKQAQWWESLCCILWINLESHSKSSYVEAIWLTILWWHGFCWLFRIYDIIFSPNGSYILVAAGNLILVIIHLEMNQICLKEGSMHAMFTERYGLFDKINCFCQPHVIISDQTTQTAKWPSRNLSPRDDYH